MYAIRYYTKNKRGEDVPVKVPYDLLHAPLIADHQPKEKITKDSPDTLPKTSLTTSQTPPDAA
jgi:hypothetical protein